MTGDENKNPETEEVTVAKLEVIEKIMVDQVEKIADMEHRIKDLQNPTDYKKSQEYTSDYLKPLEYPTPEPTAVVPEPDAIFVSNDPEVKKAKNYMAKVDAGVIEKDGGEYHRCLVLVNKDLLSRCVFELDGRKYKFTGGAFRLKGKRFTAVEAMKDERLLRFMIKQGYGSIQLIS